jgi:hypothetical protein
LSPARHRFISEPGGVLAPGLNGKLGSALLADREHDRVLDRIADFDD